MLTWRFGDAYLHDDDGVVYHETAVRSVKIYPYCTRIRRGVSTKVNGALSCNSTRADFGHTSPYPVLILIP